MEDIEVKIGHLQNRSNLARQIYLANRDVSNRWWVTLLWPSASRLARAKAEVSADSAWRYSLALEARVIQLNQCMKHAERCLSLIGNARDQEHLDEMRAMLRADGLAEL